MLRKSTIGVLICSTLLQGCALERINAVQRSAGSTADEASSLIRQAAENRPVVQFQNSQYVSPVPLPVAKYDAPREVVNCNMPYAYGSAYQREA